MEPAFISLRGVRTREFVPLKQPREVDMILHRSTDQTLSHMRQSLARVATSVGRTYSFHGAAQAGLPRRPKISRRAPLKPASGALMNLTRLILHRVASRRNAAASAGIRVDSLEHAYDFKRLDCDLRIWRVTARGLSAADRTVCDPKGNVDIEDFWRVHNGGSSYGVLEGRRTPFGTFWADEVRLDERVQSEELPQQRRSAQGQLAQYHREVRESIAGLK